MRVPTPVPPMTDGGSAGKLDVDTLEEQLKALSFSNRLELLELLQSPRTIDEIHLTPSAGAEDEDRERPLSREAVRHHLERLAEAGLVESDLVQQGDGRTRKQYVLDESQLYSVAETIRRLSRRDPREGRDPRRTQQTPRERQPSWPDPPRLLLVHGAPDPRAFPLREEDTKAPRGWVIGRDPQVHVTLDYDPYVSAENTEILDRGEDGFEVINLRNAKNGTLVNEELLAAGESQTLEHGDVLGVGSSTLVFHSE